MNVADPAAHTFMQLLLERGMTRNRAKAAT